MYRKILPALAAMFPALVICSGPAVGSPTSDQELNMYVDCPLERIGDQLVRCDVPVGAGVPAPYWIPEQQ